MDQTTVVSVSDVQKALDERRAKFSSQQNVCFKKSKKNEEAAEN